jgi:hypothetical protein
MPRLVVSAGTAAVGLYAIAYFATKGAEKEVAVPPADVGTPKRR